MMPIKSFRLLLIEYIYLVLFSENIFIYPWHGWQAKKKKESVVQQQRGQLYCRHANTMALSSSPVVSALGSESDDLGSSSGQGKVLCPWDMQEKKCKLCFLAWLNLYIIPMTWLQGQKNKNQLSRSNSGWHFHLLLVVEVVPSLTH